jgi:hypothetical protein
VVHEAYGGSAQPIDVAVEDPRRPGRVLVAVETDGPLYAGMRSTRDRDRLRVEQLGRLGWEHVRVWETDLFRDPARDVARVVAAAHRASERAATGRVEAAGPAVSAEPAEPEPEPVESDEPSSESGETAGEEPRQRRVLRRKPKRSPEERSPEERSPEQTRDDTDAGWGEYTDTSAHDRWLQDQRPPHWGRD